MKKKMVFIASTMLLITCTLSAQTNNKTSTTKDLPVSEKNVGVNRGQNYDRTGGQTALPSSSKASTGQSSNYERRTIYEGTKPVKKDPAIGSAKTSSGATTTTTSGSGQAKKSSNAN